MLGTLYILSHLIHMKQLYEVNYCSHFADEEIQTSNYAYEIFQQDMEQKFKPSQIGFWEEGRIGSTRNLSVGFPCILS